MDGFVVWFTGLSGAGKSTLAAMLSAELRARGVRVEVLDGDEVRTHLSKGLGFSREDRDTNVRRIGFVAKLVARAGACAMTAAISPYKAIRDEQRAQIGRFVEIYCKCPLEALAARDPKGLYAKALAGEIQHFTGVDDPYEPPDAPEIVVETDHETREESLGRIVAKLEALGYVPRREAVVTATSRDPSIAHGLPAPHGGELVRRIVAASAREALEERARSLPRVELSRRDADAVALVASGAYSPLRGFMVEREYRRVVGDARLENGLPWPVPVTLAVSEEQAQAARARGQVALAHDGALLAVLDVADAFRRDKQREAALVMGTADRSHPGVAALEAAGPVCLGGELLALDAIDRDAASNLARDPADVRARLLAMGARSVAALASDRALDRADEHLTKTALASADALLVLALAEPARAWPLPLRVRARAIEALIASYYRADRVVLAARPGGRFASPAREAVLDALVAKTYGASQVVFSPDCASEGGRESARAAFAVYAPSEIGITPLWFEDAFHSTPVGSTATDRTAPADPATRVAWSTTELAQAFARGELPPSHAMRPEVAAIVAGPWPERNPALSR